MIIKPKLNECLDYMYIFWILTLEAICAGLTNYGGRSCTQHYSSDSIRKRDGSVVRDSGGSCSAPETCTDCNDGFYGDGPKCKSMKNFIFLYNFYHKNISNIIYINCNALW
jgi:hypothetical protein